MIDARRPLRLARKARLRFDARSGKHLLLYPERGLELSASAARITQLCAEGLSASAIVARLAVDHPGEAPARLEAEVMDFLRALEARGLVEVAPEGWRGGDG